MKFSDYIHAYIHKYLNYAKVFLSISFLPMFPQFRVFKIFLPTYSEQLVETLSLTEIVFLQFRGHEADGLVVAVEQRPP